MNRINSLLACMIGLIFVTIPVWAQTTTKIITTKDCVTMSNQPNTNFNGDALAVCYNSAENLYVASLVYFNISSIPATATITSAYLYLYCFSEPYGNVSLRIGRLASSPSWTETGVTWNNMPYGETPPAFKYFPVVSGTWNEYDVEEFVDAWYAGTYNNNGFQLFTTTNGTLAMFYERGAGSSWAPYLEIRYRMRLYDGEVYTHSYDPGCYEYYQDVNYWSVVGVRPSTGTDYNIRLYSDANYSDLLASSARSGTAVDFIVADYNHSPKGWDYPKVIRYSGSGSYKVEWENGVTFLLAPGVNGTYSWGSGHVVRVWRVYLAAGETFKYTLNITSGSCDLGMALFKSSGASYYAGRSAAVWEEDDNGSGGDEVKTSYTAPSSDWYALVVWCNNNSSGNYQIVIGNLHIAGGVFENNPSRPPRSNIIVYLTGTLIQRDTTDSEGLYRFDGLVSGNYEVYCQGTSYHYSLSLPPDTHGINFVWTGTGYTDVDDFSSMENIPKEFSLNQNYPNPFNLSTEISYSLPTDADVNLTIYNLRGQRIRVLVNEHQQPGNKTIHWDGKDEQGKQVASGIYFYKIQAGEFSQAKKMVLIK